MILYCNFEELAALTSGANRLLAGAGGDHPVLAPPQGLADLEQLLPRLDGDLTLATLAEQRTVRRAVAFLLDDLAQRMDIAIVEQHPAAEDAVLAYFDYAHTRSVLHRLDQIGAQMAAIIELATGAPADDGSAQSFSFLD